jgi:predicted dehydrogenase
MLVWRRFIMTRIFNIGVIGAGMWGKTHISMFQEEGRATVTWIYDANPTVAKATQDKFRIKNVAREIGEMLDDPQLDAVVVASPPSSHVAIGIQVLRANKHLLIEKPMAVNREETLAIVTETTMHPNLVVLEVPAVTLA